MTRVILLCERPSHLRVDEALAWFRTAAAALASGDGIASVQLSELDSASMHWDGGWDWLVEAELYDGVDAHRLVSNSPWCDFLADLRLLGMHATLTLADPARTTTLESTS